VILWHVYGTPGRPPATTDSDRLSLGALTRDFVGAPSRIRTCGLLLRSNPAVDAVAICDDAGQVRGGAHCCSPSYLVIASRDTGCTPPPRTRHGSYRRKWLPVALSSVGPIGPVCRPRRQSQRGQPRALP